MKKILASLFIGLSAMASAQISFAGKAHLLFPTGSPTWKNISQTATNAYTNSGKNSAGFNIGVSAKVNLPGSFFIMPELYFTSFKNEYDEPTTNTTLKAKNNRIDIPVLAGYNVWGDTVGVFLGPVASYNLTSDNTFKNFKENAKTQFTIGYQFGLQAQFSRIIANARYEGAFSKDQRKFVNTISGNTEINYDNRPSLFMLGLGYKF